jgi:hypothetical protein
MSEETKKPKAAKKASKPEAKNFTLMLIDKRHGTPKSDCRFHHKGTKESLIKKIKPWCLKHPQQCIRDIRFEELSEAIREGKPWTQRSGKFFFTYELTSE